MNSYKKSKDQQKKFSSQQKIPYNKSYTYNLQEQNQAQLYHKNRFEFDDRNTLKITKATKADIILKKDENLIKTMQKCNEKMQYYKLMGSLQQQKRSVLQQQNIFLQQENQQLKEQIFQLKKENSKFQKKVQKLKSQRQNKNNPNEYSQKDFMIELPKKRKKSQTSNHKASNKVKNEQKQNNCLKCIQIEAKLQQQRYLYEKDRKYLKQKIQHLSSVLDQIQRQDQNQQKQLQYNEDLLRQRQLQILDQFQQQQNALKKQLTRCYKIIQDKTKLLTSLQLKLDYFQSQNHRILKLLTQFDFNFRRQNNKIITHKNIIKQKQQYFDLNAPGFQRNNRNQNKQRVFLNDIDSFQNHIPKNHADNRKQGRRRCGSIKVVN